MADEEDGARLRRAAQANHQVALARDGGQHLDIAGGKSGGAEAGGHGFGGARVVARGIGGIDFDQLFEDLAGQFLVGRLGAERHQREKDSEKAHTVIMPLGRMLIITGLVLVAVGLVVSFGDGRRFPSDDCPAIYGLKARIRRSTFP